MRHRPKIEPLLLTIDQFCDCVGVGRTLVYNLIRAGKIKSVKIAGRHLIPMEEARRIAREGID